MNPTQEIRETEDEILHCTVHPDRETTLRCNKCGRPMCTKCAVSTPVGYRCRECVRGIQAGYYKATNNDYIIIAVACAGLTLVAAAIASAINLGILFTLILAIPIGGGIGELALRITSRRRGRQSANIAAAGAVIGGLAGGFIRTFLYYQSLVARVGARAEQLGGSLLNLALTATVNDIGLLVFVGLVAVVVYGRFKMRS
ncbi:MAG: B-box zinc finger protein [Chloroflexota bacterium]